MRERHFLKFGCCHYIQIKSLNGRAIFTKDIDYEYFLRLIKKFKNKFMVHVYAFCLLPGEVHLILHPQASGSLDVFVDILGWSYEVYFNTHYEQNGSLWDERFKNLTIEEDGELMETIKIIEFMPVKEGLNHSPVSYKWSSCAYRVLGDSWILDVYPPEQLARNRMEAAGKLIKHNLTGDRR